MRGQVHYTSYAKISPPVTPDITSYAITSVTSDPNTSNRGTGNK